MQTKLDNLSDKELIIINCKKVIHMMKENHRLTNFRDALCKCKDNELLFENKNFDEYAANCLCFYENFLHNRPKQLQLCYMLNHSKLSFIFSKDEKINNWSEIMMGLLNKYKWLYDNF